MKTLILALIVSYGSAALAIDSTLCPDSFQLNITKISAYQSSDYQDVTGWKDARDVLAANTADISLDFERTATTATTCFYKSATGETVKLFSFQKDDPESSEDFTINLMSVFFKVGGARYNIAPEIQDLTGHGIEVWHGHPTERTKLRVPLKVDGKWLDFPIGLGFVEVL